MVLDDSYIYSNVKRIIECSDKIEKLSSRIDFLTSVGEHEFSPKDSNEIIYVLSQLGYVSEQLGSDVSALMDMLGD